MCFTFALPHAFFILHEYGGCASSSLSGHWGGIAPLNPVSFFQEWYQCFQRSSQEAKQLRGRSWGKGEKGKTESKQNKTKQKKETNKQQNTRSLLTLSTAHGLMKKCTEWVVGNCSYNVTLWRRADYILLLIAWAWELTRASNFWFSVVQCLLLPSENNNNNNKSVFSFLFTLLNSLCRVLRMYIATIRSRTMII